MAVLCSFRRWSIAGVGVVAILAAGSVPVALALDDGTATTGLSLRLVDDPVLSSMGEIGGLKHVAASDGIIVTLAECEEADCTEVARSEDGLTWEMASGTLADWPLDLIGSDAGFVALTTDGGGRRVDAHTSTDGRDWQRSHIGNLGPAAVLAASPEGVLALGCEGPGCFPETYGERKRARSTTTVWTSADGLTWSRQAPDVLQGTILTAAATSGDTVVAIGREAGSTETAAAFAYVGGAWQPLGLPLPRVRGQEVVDLIDVAGLPGGGFVITGEILPYPYEPLGEPFLLTSRDGVSWEPQETFLESGDPDILLHAQPPAEGTDSLVATLATELDLGSARPAFDRSILAWSDDGSTWSTVPVPAEGRMRAYVDDMTVTPDGRMLLAGSMTGGRSERPALWLGTLGPADATADPGPSDQGARDRPSARNRRSPSFTSAERVLLEAVVPDIAPTCVPRRTELPEGTVAALQCAPTSPVVRDMAYYLLEGDDAKAVFDERMRENRVQARSTMSCKRGTPGYEYATGGLDADGCYVNSDGRANLRIASDVTNCRVLRAGATLLSEPAVYVAVLGEDADIGALWRWHEQGVYRLIERPDAASSPACPS